MWAPVPLVAVEMEAAALAAAERVGVAVEAAAPRESAQWVAGRTEAAAAAESLVAAAVSRAYLQGRVVAG